MQATTPSSASPPPRRVPPDPVAALLLDLDGTLVDTEFLHYRSTLQVLAEWDVHLTEKEFGAYIGYAELPYWEDLRQRLGLPLAAEELAQRRTEEYLRILHRTSIDPLPGVLELLHEARSRGLPMAVASSSPRDQIQASLHAAGLQEFLPVFRSGHEDVAPGRGKPCAEVYLAAAEALGVDPRCCIAVEDSAVGIRAAQAAGCFTVCVPCASHPTTEAELAEVVVSRISEVTGLLGA